MLLTVFGLATLLSKKGSKPSRKATEPSKRANRAKRQQGQARERQQGRARKATTPSKRANRAKQERQQSHVRVVSSYFARQTTLTLSIEVTLAGMGAQSPFLNK